MGICTVLFGGDRHGQDLHVQKQMERLVPEAFRTWNYHWLDMSVPAQRFRGWELARTPGWGEEQPRVVVFDNAQALDKLKGSGKFDAKDDQLSPSQKGNKLATKRSNELAAAYVSARSNNVHLFVLLRDAAPAIGVNTPLVEAARDDGRLIEFSKSASWDKESQVAHVQRVGQALGLLVDEDVATVMTEQLADDDGQLIETELRKLMLWAATTGEELDPAVVGELCSYGAISPLAWATELVSRPRSQRRFLDLTQLMVDQRVDLMTVLGTLLTKAHQALLFKTLEGEEADPGTVAAVLRWSNPRRVFPVRRELSRTTIGYVNGLIDLALELRERVLIGTVTASPTHLMDLVVEGMGQLHPE